MLYPQILRKTIFELKITTIILVMCPCFPQEILSYMGPKIWDLAPKDMMQVIILMNSRSKSNYGN